MKRMKVLFVYFVSVVMNASLLAVPTTEDDINVELKRVAQFVYDERKASETCAAYLYPRCNARWALVDSAAYKNYQATLERYERGMAIAEEVIAARITLVRTDVYQEDIEITEEAIAACALSSKLSKKFNTIPEKLIEVVNLRNWKLEEYIEKESSWECDSDIMQKINKKFPINYSADQVNKILLLGKQYKDEWKKVAESGKNSFEGYELATNDAKVKELDEQLIKALKNQH